jgi:hypothetical protein
MMAMRAKSLLIPLVLALPGVLAGVAGCGNNVPPFPTYSKDVKPIMEANCIRCHGAGGSLNADPDIAKVNGQPAPTMSDFTQLADANGRFGLLHYTSQTPGGVTLMTAFLPQMPPPPSPVLGGYELDVLEAWIKDPRP